MSTSRTSDLTLKFTIARQDDEGWPWVAELISIEPRGTGLDWKRMPSLGGFSETIVRCDPVSCNRCSKDQARPGGRICDACAVEESIACTGAEEWLLHCDLPIIFDPMPDDARFERPGCVGKIVDEECTLVVRGYMEWWSCSGTDDWDEMFHVESTGKERCS